MLAQDLGSAVQGLHGEAAPPDTPTSASPVRSSLAPKARRPGTPLSACFPAALQGACVHVQGPSLQLLQHKHPCACSLQLARELRELLSSRPSWILGTTPPPQPVLHEPQLRSEPPWPLLGGELEDAHSGAGHCQPPMDPTTPESLSQPACQGMDH